MPPDQLLFAEFHQACGGWIDEREASFEIAVVDDVGRLFGQLPVACFTFTQRFFGPYALGDVAVIDDDASNAGVVEAVDADALNVAPRSVSVPQPEPVPHRHAGLFEPLAEARLNVCMSSSWTQRKTFERHNLGDRDTQHAGGRRDWRTAPIPASSTSAMASELCSMRAVASCEAFLGLRGLMGRDLAG